MSDICVCILAYNEQKHIADTIRAVMTGNGDMTFNVIVYANGCTDNTADVVKELCRTTPNLRLRELAMASKPNAWNTAFSENANSVIVFSDGDVRPEPGSVATLCRYFDEHPEASLVASQFWPDARGLSMERRVSGFLQIPLVQDFHYGGFYAVRRCRVWEQLQRKQLQGIPRGIVGEDEFLEALMPAETFFVAGTKAFFEPPTFADLWKYFARLRWQEEQLLQGYGDLLADDARPSRGTVRSRLAKKLSSGQSPSRLLIGLIATGSRAVVKVACRGQINRCYRNLGPIRREGAAILSQSTRSESTK